MKEEEFNKLWDKHCDHQPDPDSMVHVDMGMSTKLTKAIIKAGKEGKSLALTDWTKADY